jgi:hypothetical protein
MRRARIALGVLLAALAIVLVFSPLAIANALHRPHETASQMINLRASWGGALLGIALFTAWLPALKPWKRSILGLVMCEMAGIAAARTVGFVLDGHPDSLQWFWLSAEIGIASACGWALFRARSS